MGSCVSKRDDNFDVDIAALLDKLGYSKSLAEKRVKVYKDTAAGSELVYKEKCNEDIGIVVAGSRGEGTGIYFGTDLDRLFIHRTVRCFEREQDITTSDSQTIQLSFDTEGVPSGYTKLVLKENQLSCAERGFFENRLNNALVIIDGKSYLQNNMLTTAMSRKFIWKEGWLTRNLKFGKEYNGPSKPFVVRIPFTSIAFAVDEVLAFPSVCPNIVRNWVKRERTGDWPSEELIKKVEDTDVLVVPVGVKGHTEEKLQWRLSFTLLELQLAWSFNDTQIKVYVLLKMIAKSQLKFISRKISSYVVKNILFWLFERSDIKRFIPENIMSIVKEALASLRSRLYAGNIPNYMLPELNHYEGISEKERRTLLRRLDNLIGDSCLYLRCTELKHLLSLSSVKIEKYVKEREVAEQLILSIFSLDPKSCLDVQKKIFATESLKDILNVFREVVARRRQEDPDDFFHRLRDMTNEELADTFLGSVTNRLVTYCVSRLLRRA